MNSSCIGKVVLADGQILFTHLETKGDDQDDVNVIVTVTRGMHAWKTCLSNDFLKNYASRTQSTVKQYIDMTVEALGGASQSSTMKYICEISKTKRDDIDLIWKKRLPGDDMVFKLGTSRLVSCDVCHATDFMLTYGINETQRLKVALAASDAASSEKVRERDEALAKFQHAVEAKEKLEQDLFSKFVAVLNAKKAKIRQLEEESTATKEASPADNVPPTKPGSSRTKKPVQRPPVKRSEPMSFIDTDSEEDHTTDASTPSPPKANKKTSLPTIISSNKSFFEEDDDDLFMSGFEESPEVQYMPLRARIRQPKCKKAHIETKRPFVSMSNIAQEHCKASCSKIVENVANDTHDQELCDTVALVDDM